MDDDNQFIMASTFIFLKKWKLKATLTALRASESGSFFLLLSHPSGVSVRLTQKTQQRSMTYVWKCMTEGTAA